MGKEKQKEKDVSIHHQIISEIDSVREHLKNIRDILHRDEEDDASKMVKTVIDELDLFVQEAEFSEVGHSYPLFSPQKSASSGSIRKVKNFDKEIIGEVQLIRQACKKLESMIIENDEELDFQMELQKIRQYITKTRSEFKHRMNKMKGVK